MKFLRSVDSLSQSLASSQARLFENSVSNGIPSKIFIRSFMVSKEAKLLDELNIEVAGLTENEIFDSIKRTIKTNAGITYSYSVMSFIGYFYRMAAYLTNINSKELYQRIKPDFLARNYEVLHSLQIEEAIKEVFEILHIEIEDKYSMFKRIYTTD